MIPTTHWIRFTEYHKLADLVGMRVQSTDLFGVICPSSTDSPSDLKNVSILRVQDFIMTNKMVTRKVEKSPHKRMTMHHKPLTTGECPERK